MVAVWNMSLVGANDAFSQGFAILAQGCTLYMLSACEGAFIVCRCGLVFVNECAILKQAVGILPTVMKMEGRMSPLREMTLDEISMMPEEQLRAVWQLLESVKAFAHFSAQIIAN